MGRQLFELAAGFDPEARNPSWAFRALGALLAVCAFALAGLAGYEVVSRPPWFDLGGVGGVLLVAAALGLASWVLFRQGARARQAEHRDADRLTWTTALPSTEVRWPPAPPPPPPPALGPDGRRPDA